MDKSLRIVYMGTPEFAVEPLCCLIQNGYNVVGVVTMPDKPAGRCHHIQYSAVKDFALSNNLPLLQPERLKDEDFLKALHSWNADLQIVVAFRMLPEVVWSMPRLGTFNLHASLLPQYRGAAPINWAIINGERETGVTTFFLKQEIDTGAIIGQKKITINDTDNVGLIHDKLMTIGAELVIETVDKIIKGNIKPVEQQQLEEKCILKAAPKIFKEDCRINWNTSVEHIYNLIRGLSPYPIAWTELQTPNGIVSPVKIYETAKTVTNTSNQTPGCIITDKKKYLRVIASNGYIEIKQLQLPGKKRMSVEDFLRGHNISENKFI